MIVYLISIHILYMLHGELVAAFVEVCMKDSMKLVECFPRWVKQYKRHVSMLLRKMIVSILYLYRISNKVSNAR